MKNLLAFTALLAAGYWLGSRRPQKKFQHSVVITADGRALSGVLQLELDRKGRVLGHG
jgi:hypothetical protein